jgi:flagellin
MLALCPAANSLIDSRICAQTANVSFVARLLRKESAGSESEGESVSIMISSNYAGMNTVRNISLIQRSISRTAQQLTSGLEVDQASDEPAALEISEQMRSQIGTLTQHIKNLEFNLNKNHAADSAISELRRNLAEIRGVAVAAADAYVATPETGKAYQTQINDLVATYNQQLSSAEYAGQKLFDSSSGPTSRLAPLPEFTVAYPEEAEAAVGKIDSEMASLKQAAEAVVAQSKWHYRSAVSSLEAASQDITVSESQIRDTDYAENQAIDLKLQLQREADMAATSLGSLSSESVFKLLHA